MTATDLLERPVEAPRTTLPVRAATEPAAVPRQRRGIRRDDVLALGGAALSGLSAGLLLFGRLAPLSGALGFVVVTFGLFLAAYTLLLRLTEGWPAVIDRLVTVVLSSAAVLAGVALASVVLFTLWRGRNALTKLNLYTEDMRSTGPLDELSQGGISHALVGTLVIMALALVWTVPLGLLTAVFLTESRASAAMIVRTVVDAMTALPSILAGLFVFAAWVLTLGFERSGLAASLAVSIMMLPIIIRSSDVVLRLVPGSLREAAAALGAPEWRTVWHVVLPTARSGLATAVILGLARGVGETAPILLTAGFTSTLNADPRQDPMVALPLVTFDFVRSPQPSMVERGFATAAVLMAVVLVLFTVARIVGGKPAGQLSARQRRRVSARSARDVDRLRAREAAA